MKGGGGGGANHPPKDKKLMRLIVPTRKQKNKKSGNKIEMGEHLFLAACLIQIFTRFPMMNQESVCCVKAASQGCLVVVVTVELQIFFQKYKIVWNVVRLFYYYFYFILFLGVVVVVFLLELNQTKKQQWGKTIFSRQ